MTELIALLKKIISASPNLLDGVTSIDEAIRQTIAGMPNALKLLENS